MVKKFQYIILTALCTVSLPYPGTSSGSVSDITSVLPAGAGSTSSSSSLSRTSSSSILFPPNPSPSPPSSFVSSVSSSSPKLGFYDYMVQESTPVMFNGDLLMMESILMNDPQWAGYWDPSFSNCSCYYRIRNQYTGTIIVNISQSCNHAFGVAMVQTNNEGLDTFFIYGTPWIRMVSPSFPSSSSSSSFPSESSSSTIVRRKGIEWSGLCSNPSTCTIDAFVSNDPFLQNWTSYLSVIVPNQTVFNPTIARIGSTVSESSVSLPSSSIQWLMATEGVGGPRFYINNSTNPTDSLAWSLLDPTVYNVDTFGTNEIGSCPSIRYDPVSGYVYYLTGGNNLYIIRSRSLQIGSWELGQNNGIMLTPDQLDCQLIANSPFGGFYVPNSNATIAIQNCQSNPKGFGDDSDVDLVEIIIPNTNPPRIGTLLQYGSGNQKTFGFSNLALYNGSMFDVLDSFFTPER